MPMEIDQGSVLDALPAMAWTALPDGNIDFVNRRWSDYTGLGLHEGHGWEWQAAVDPRDLPQMLERWRSILASGEPGEVEARLRRSDGQYRSFLVQCSPMRDEAGRLVKWCGVATDVDNLRRAEETLRRRELDFQLIVDSIPIPVAVTTATGDVEGLNQPTLDYFGKTFEELRGWKASEVVHPDDLEHTVSAQIEAHRNGCSYNVESRHLRADGTYRWYNVLGMPLRDSQGTILRWLHLLIDIDDRKLAEQARQQSEASLATAERDLQLMIDTIPVFVATYRPDGTRDFVNRIWRDYIGLTTEEATGSKAKTFPHFHPDDIDRNDKAWRASLASGEPLAIEVRVRRADGQYRWHSSRRVPLRDANGDIVRWYSVGIDIDDQKCAEEALRESESKARAIVDGIPGFVAILTPDGKTDVVNRQMAEYHGLTTEELKRWATNRTIHEDDLPAVTEIFNQAIASQTPYEIEYRLRRFDGVYRWFYSRGIPLRDDTGRITCWYALQTDIDDRKRVEQALRESERKARLIVDTIPAGAALMTPAGEVEVVNRQLADYFGKTFEELARWGTSDSVHPDDLPRVIERFKHSIATGSAYDNEQRQRRFDGVYRWFHVRGLPISDAEGALLGWNVLHIDIDERKRAEDALAASGRNLRLIIDTIPALAWSARSDGTAEFLSQHYLDYAGLTAEQAQGWGWTAVVHPDDLPGLATIWQAILASGKPGEAEARLRHHDGEYRWFLFRVSPLRDENGTIIKWYGVNTDIEDRKRSEEGFRAIVETTPECVKVISRDGMVLRTNAAGAVMAGVPSTDVVVGRNFFDFVATEHRAGYREFHEKVCAGQKGFLEFDLISAQGVRRHMETHAAPMRHNDGSIVQLGVTRDITERKRAEEKLRRSEAFLAEGQHLARMGSLSWRVASGEIIWSEQLYRIFEVEPGSAVTLELIASRVHPEDMPLMVDMVARAQRGENYFEYQHRIILPDRSVKHLHLIAHRTGDDPGQIEYIGAVLDITERRLADEALNEARSELAHVARVSSLGALTASIAHEVNQPLAGIITNASTCLRMLAADPPNVDGARETARRTIRDGNRAADVIARLRALFSKKTVAIEPVDLNQAVREVVALSWGDLQRSRVVVRTELTDGLPLVDGDRIQLQQVIMNLLRNAADAMNSVDDRPRRLLIGTGPGEGDHVRLCVQDAGVGFGPEGADRLFQAFYTTKGDGMGIGLSISRSIIESHNGRLWAQTNDGPGATFFFSIPQHSGEEASGHEIGTGQAPPTSNTQPAAGIS
jgi:PAS domain S-box-containing protein